MGMQTSTAVTGVKIQTAPDHTATNGAAARIVSATPAVLATQGVTVQALAANTNKVRVGDASVGATQGVELSAGDSIFIPQRDPHEIWSWGLAASQGLTVTWV